MNMKERQIEIIEETKKPYTNKRKNIWTLKCKENGHNKHTKPKEKQIFMKS